MARNNINHDVSELLVKYDISDILNEIMDVASDKAAHAMRLWFEREIIGNNVAMDSAAVIAGEVDENAIEAIFHELGHVNMRLSKLEHAVVEPVDSGSKDEMVITKEKMDEIVKFLKANEGKEKKDV
jgi:hypothetical protein